MIFNSIYVASFYATSFLRHVASKSRHFISLGFNYMAEKPTFKIFCHRRILSDGDYNTAPLRVVCVSVCLCVQTLKILLNLYSDFDETLSVVFLGHLKLKSRVSKKSEYIYYPLPMYFCSIFGVIFV